MRTRTTLAAVTLLAGGLLGELTARPTDDWTAEKHSEALGVD
jgi:hypothetical protein